MVLYAILKVFRWKFRFSSVKLSKLVVASIAIFLQEQSGVFGMLANFMFCIQFDPNVDVTYIKYDPKLQCDASYYWYLNKIVYPNFLVWAAVIPALVLCILVYNKRQKSLDSPILRLILGGTYNEYNERGFFWGTI